MSESEPIQLSVEEKAVVGVMRRSEMAKKAIYNYAMKFTSSP